MTGFIFFLYIYIYIYKTVYVCICIYLHTHLSARVGCDTRSTFKWSLTRLNSEFSFPYTSYHNKVKEPSVYIYIYIYINRSLNPDHKTRPTDNPQKKRNWRIVDFAVPVDIRVKIKESEKGDNDLDLARELKQIWNLRVNVIGIVIGALGTISKPLVKRLEDLEFRGQGKTIKTSALIGQNTKWTFGDLRRLAVIQTPVKDHQLTLVWKTQ